MAIRKDLHNNVKPVIALNTSTVGSSTTTAGNIIDIKGFGAVEFLISLGTRTDGTFTPLIEEGDAADLSDAQAVSDNNLFGTEALAALTASNTVKRVGYWVGKYRYVRLSIVSSGVTSGSTGVTGIAVLANPDQAPTE